MLLLNTNEKITPSAVFCNIIYFSVTNDNKLINLSFSSFVSYCRPRPPRMAVSNRNWNWHLKSQTSEENYDMLSDFNGLYTTCKFKIVLILTLFSLMSENYKTFGGGLPYVKSLKITIQQCKMFKIYTTYYMNLYGVLKIKS